MSAAGEFTTELVAGFEGLDAAAREAFAYRPGADFFASLDWFECLAGHGLDGPPPVRIAVLGDRRAPAAALFASADGQRLRALGNYYSTRFDLALAPGADPERACRALAGGLRLMRPRWTAIELRWLRADRAATAALAAALVAAGYAVDPFFQYVDRYAAVTPGDFAGYLAARPSRLRHTLARRARQAGRRGLGMEVLTRPGPGLERGIAAYERVYAASWKRPEPAAGFMPALARRACELGVGRLGILTIAGEPAAAQLWLVGAGQALLYKLAYHPDFAGLSPGSLLTAEVLRHVIDGDRVGEIDFGIGDEPYKQDWVDLERDVIGIEALDPATLGGGLGRARRAVRDLLRRAGWRHHRPIVLGAPAGRVSPKAVT